MGTNYYLTISDKTPERLKELITQDGEFIHSEQDIKGLHIGKSSGGWCFSLHVHPTLKINSLKDWKKLFDQGLILNEYMDHISTEDMLKCILEREGSPQAPRNETQFNQLINSINSIYKSFDDYLNKNHAKLGPYNLLRHKVDGIHCIKNGKGTYDLIIGEFS